MDLLPGTPGVGIDSTQVMFNSTWNTTDVYFMVTNDLGFMNKTTRKIFLSQDHYQVQKFLTNIITPIICAFGFLGNTVNIIVLSRFRKLRTDGVRDSGIHLGLIVLAVSDMLFCFAMCPRFLVSESSSVFKQKDFRWFYQVIKNYIVGQIKRKRAKEFDIEFDLTPLQICKIAFRGGSRI